MKKISKALICTFTAVLIASTPITYGLQEKTASAATMTVSVNERLIGPVALKDNANFTLTNNSNDTVQISIASTGTYNLPVLFLKKGESHIFSTHGLVTIAIVERNRGAYGTISLKY